jgi:hypothetical protein
MVTAGEVMYSKPAAKQKEMESAMPDLRQLPNTINQVFNILDLLVVRLTLLGLAALGAYSLFKHHV